MSLGLLLGLAASCAGEEQIPNERTTGDASSQGDGHDDEYDQGESYYAGPDDGSWDDDHHDHDASTTTSATTSGSTDTGTSTGTDTDTDTDGTDSDDTTGGNGGTTTGG